MPNIILPITVVTKKLAANKTDSIFYAGKVIANLQVGNREYVLTTAGEYIFRLKPEGRVWDHRHSASLTDKDIKHLGEDDLVDNWGWFGINLWINGQCQTTPTDAYSSYDEAMEAFTTFIQKDLNHQ
jgi:hypothetical protein